MEKCITLKKNQVSCYRHLTCDFQNVYKNARITLTFASRHPGKWYCQALRMFSSWEDRCSRPPFQEEDVRRSIRDTSPRFSSICPPTIATWSPRPNFRWSPINEESCRRREKPRDPITFAVINHFYRALILELIVKINTTHNSIYFNEWIRMLIRNCIGVSYLLCHLHTWM